MEFLPIELKLNILAIALDIHPIPSNILRAHSSFNHTLAPILHTHVRLQTLSQLYAFGKSAQLCRNPKTFTLRLPGGTMLFPRRAEGPVDTQEAPPPSDIGDTATHSKDEDITRMKIVDNGGIWGCLAAALRNCKHVDNVFLRLNSFVVDPNVGMIATALSIIK